MLKIGHRGAAGYEVENTLKSFRKALDLKVDIIELDVHQCATGEFVVFHDKRIKRLTEEKGNIRKLTLAEIKSLHFSDGQGILTLTEVLNLIAGKCMVNIELKSRGAASALKEILDRCIASGQWQIDQFIISSFFHRELRRLKALNENFKIGLLYYRNLRSIPKKAKKMGAYSVHLNKRYLGKKMINKLRDYGIKIFVWTINYPADIKKARDLEIDGIITDFPDLV